jgi:RNA polymerase sigma-70 factor (ECF subfamily)
MGDRIAVYAAVHPTTSGTNRPAPAAHADGGAETRQCAPEPRGLLMQYYKPCRTTAHPSTWSLVHRDVSADRSGLVGLRAAVLAMTAGAVPQPPRPLGAGAAVTPVPRGSSTLPPARGGSDPQPPAPAPAPKTEAPPRPDADAARMLALVEKAQEGDGEAFGRLYDAYVDTVYRYIYYRVSSKALAEDLTQETFLRALRRISTFTWQGRDFGAWLVTIARNLVADHFKSSRHRLEVPTGEMLDSDESVASPEESVLAYLSNRALLDAVKQLNSQQQECVTLRFLHGLSVAETAQIMGKNDGAIKTLQYRAIRTLARLLPADLR